MSDSHQHQKPTLTPRPNHSLTSPKSMASHSLARAYLVPPRTIFSVALCSNALPFARTFPLCSTRPLLKCIPSPRQRQATKDTSTITGTNVLRIINEAVIILW
ncbi:hypothetical protein M405DRAFT_939195 [Rhizopogon salebrosus TDB-379]|nr:hypothetical protein M405DRAFT_939195 [Rhizopogon salebrosus TDB-379]